MSLVILYDTSDQYTKSNFFSLVIVYFNIALKILYIREKIKYTMCPESI